MTEQTLKPTMTDSDLRIKLVETVAPMITASAGLNAGLVGRQTLKRANSIVDAVLARINGEGCKIVRAP